MGISALRSPLLEARPGTLAVSLREAAAWLVAMLVFTLPWEDQWVIGEFGTFTRAFGIGAFGAGVAAVFAGGRMRTLRPAHVAMLLFLVWSALSLYWTIDDEATAYTARTYLQLIGLVWLIHEFGSSAAEQRRLMKAFVLGTYVSAIGTFASYATGGSGYWQRYVAPGFDPNDLCVILAMSVPMGFVLSLSEPHAWQRWLWRLHPAVVILAALLTASRAGFIAMCAAMLTVPALYRYTARGTRSAMLASGAAVVLAVAIWVPPEAVERISSLPAEIRSMELGDRATIWWAGWEALRERPFTGLGAGSFGSAVRPLLGEWAVAHNVFLTVLAETGLIGLLLFASVLALSAGSLAHAGRMQRRMWSVVALSWLTAALTLAWAHRKPTWFLLAMLLTAASAGQERRDDAR